MEDLDDLVSDFKQWIETSLKNETWGQYTTREAFKKTLKVIEALREQLDAHEGEKAEAAHGGLAETATEKAQTLHELEAEEAYRKLEPKEKTKNGH